MVYRGRTRQDKRNWELSYNGLSDTDAIVAAIEWDDMYKPRTFVEKTDPTKIPNSFFLGGMLQRFDWHLDRFDESRFGEFDEDLDPESDDEFPEDDDED